MSLEGLTNQLNQMEKALDSLYEQDAQLELKENDLLESLTKTIRERVELEIQFKQLDQEIVHLGRELLEKALGMKRLTRELFDETRQDQLIEALRKKDTQLFDRLIEGKFH